MRTLIICHIALASGILSGCHSSDARPTAPVSGRVTYRGQPLDHGRVAFIHESGHGAADNIRPDGQYSLEAIVGANKIAIECLDPDSKATVPGRPDLTLPVSLIPERYSNHMTSGLTFEVQDGDNSPADFTLVD